MGEYTSGGGLQLLSSVFKEGEEIPHQFTCKGQNINPPLNIVGVPPDAKSLALIMHDPDAVSGDFVHWIAWDLPASTDSIAPSSVPVGAIQGLNDSGKSGYTGPCPPAGTGTHHYKFELYALNTNLGLSGNSKRDDLKEAMRDHIINQYTLTGIFRAD